MGQNNKEGVEKAFQTIFGEEHSGAVRCYGRNVTKTSLKRKEEINALKKAHNEEVTALHGKMHNMEDRIGRLEYAFKVLLHHCNPEVNMEALEDFLRSSPDDASSGQKVNDPHAHSSTSIHAPNLGKVIVLYLKFDCISKSKFM